MQRAARDKDVRHVVASTLQFAIGMSTRSDLLAQRLVVAMQRPQPAVLPCDASSAAPLPAAAS